MPPHERNPICIKDSEHIIELIKLRFDASDARQEEIRKQVVYTNGRTRKLEDSHIEQISQNREQCAVNRELLEFVVYQKKYNEDREFAEEELKSRLRIILWAQKNWIALITIILSIFALGYSNKKEDESTTKHQQPNTSNSIENNRSLDGYSSGSGELGRSNTVFRVH